MTFIKTKGKPKAKRRTLQWSENRRTDNEPAAQVMQVTVLAPPQHAEAESGRTQAMKLAGLFAGVVLFLVAGYFIYSSATGTTHRSATAPSPSRPSVGVSSPARNKVDNSYPGAAGDTGGQPAHQAAVTDAGFIAAGHVRKKPDGDGNANPSVPSATRPLQRAPGERFPSECVVTGMESDKSARNIADCLRLNRPE